MPRAKPAAGIRDACHLLLRRDPRVVQSAQRMKTAPQEVVNHLPKNVVQGKGNSVFLVVGYQNAPNFFI